eukprot:scaffold54164_cov26-Tisochrysis_lutea.AAC.1
MWHMHGDGEHGFTVFVRRPKQPVLTMFQGPSLAACRVCEAVPASFQIGHTKASRSGYGPSRWAVSSSANRHWRRVMVRILWPCLAHSAARIANRAARTKQHEARSGVSLYLHL